MDSLKTRQRFIEFETGMHDAEYLNPDGTRKRPHAQVEQEWQEQDLLEWIEAEERRRNYETRRKNYKAFYQEAKFLLNGDSNRLRERRIDALVKYFPGRFSPKGIQPIQDYDSAKVYGLFRKMYKEAERRR